jgi:hypothetical protein
VNLPLKYRSLCNLALVVAEEQFRLLSDVMPTTQLATELNDELQGEIPYGRGVILILKWPVSNKRTVKEHLRKELRQLLSSSDSTRNLRIEGNEISIEIRSHSDGPGYIAGVATSSSLPFYDVQTTAWCALEERIRAKAEKCRSLKFKGPVWLALFDRYRLADVDTHRRAMNKLSVDHPFEKILVISHDGSVDELFGNGGVTDTG